MNSFFAMMTMFIAIPAGVLVFNWILTMYKAKVNFASPMYWFVGFIILFMIGGMSGIFMASPPADFQVHNSLFLVAHFHTNIIGIALFGIFAGTTYWFPKIFGFKLDENLGKRAFWFWFIGYFVAFIPMYLLGFMGAPRRIDHYDASTGWQPLFITSFLGFIIISSGILTQIYMIIKSIKNRDQNRDLTGDPWNGRTLEWASHSPPPFYNFALLPPILSHEPFWDLKKQGWQPDKNYKPIEGFKNTGMGIYISVFAFIAGFAIVWHVFWLALLGLIGAIVCVIILSFDDHLEYEITAEEIAKIEKTYDRKN